MKKIFVTVGTTSFDELVKSICSFPCLTSLIEECRLSNENVSVDNDTHDNNGTNDKSDTSDTNGSTEAFEILIQYGKGQSPLSFLPSSLLNDSLRSIKEANDGNDNSSDATADEGSAILSFPMISSSSVANSYHGRIRWYRFRPSLLPDMKASHVIVCHAGAGTLMDALTLKQDPAMSSSAVACRHEKSLIINAVVNTRLMHNHQLELARELYKRGNIRVTWDVVKGIVGNSSFWKDVLEFEPVPFASGNVDQMGISQFQWIIDDVMGFSNHGHANNVGQKAREKYD